MPDDVKILSNLVKVLMAMIRDKGWTDALDTETREGIETVRLVSPATATELNGVFGKLMKSLDRS